MSKPGETVTIDAELLLNRLEALEQAIADIRQAAAQGVYGRPTPFKTVRPASPSGINIHLLEWKTKSSQPASESASWAWAFAYDQEGYIRDEARQLVQEIERYGKIEVGGYEISLGGRDKRLLNRKKLNTQGR